MYKFKWCGNCGNSGKRIVCDSAIAETPTTCESWIPEIGGAEGKETIEKPPRGIRPRWLVDELRMEELLGAIARFTEAKETIPQEWIEEYKELREKMEGRGTVTLTNVNNTNEGT